VGSGLQVVDMFDILLAPKIVIGDVLSVCMQTTDGSPRFLDLFFEICCCSLLIHFLVV